MARARRLVPIIVLAALNLVQPASARAVQVSAPSPSTRPAWMAHIDAAIGHHPMSVTVGSDGNLWYGHLGWVGRPPASNEKLLLSMALYDRYVPWNRILTDAEAGSRPDAHGVINGNLW